MKLTNKFGIPEPFVRAMENDPYFKGDGVAWSVSDLIAPVQQVILKHRHWAEIEEDASEGVWKLFGKMAHYVLEKSAESEALSEERLFLEVYGKKISGAFDRFKGGKLTDYKVTSVWSAIYGSRTADWTSQLNLYAYMLNSTGFEVTSLEVYSIYRDWRERELTNDRKGNYPKISIEAIPLKLWTLDEQREFMERKVKALIIAENDADDKLTPCTDEQMWSSPAKWALMKEGRKSAVSLHDTMGAAEKAEEIESAKAKKGGFYVQLRPAERKRCGKYCPASPFCHQYKEWLATGNQTGEEQDNGGVEG